MRILGGTTVEVWRAPTARDRFGDVDRVKVGEIEHCVFQRGSAASMGLRFHGSTDYREAAALAAVLYAPRDAALKIESRDRLKFEGGYYQVVGERAWDQLNPATLHDFGYYMVQVEMVD